METRMERYKRIKKEKRIRKLKFITILISLSLVYYSLLVVNNTIIGFDVLENDNLIQLSIDEWKIDILGKSYYIDIERIKKVFN